MNIFLKLVPENIKYARNMESPQINFQFSLKFAESHKKLHTQNDVWEQD